jgi:hypothetical protein
MTGRLFATIHPYPAWFTAVLANEVLTRMQKA